MQPTLNVGVLVSFLVCYIALAINDLGSIQSMNRLLEVKDMDRRILRGVTVTGFCNVLSGCLGIGLPLLIGTVISFLPADVLGTFPVVLRPVLGNGFVVERVGAFLLDRLVFFRG